LPDSMTQGGHPRWRLGVHHCLPWWACRVSSGRTLGSALAAPVLAIVLLGGCASIPSGPSVMVLPGTGKTFEQFQTDDAVCRQWAAHSVGTEPNKAATESTVGGAAVGTVLGAAAGALIGAASGSPATGAAVGAGFGLLGGTAVGAGARCRLLRVRARPLRHRVPAVHVRQGESGSVVSRRSRPLRPSV